MITIANMIRATFRLILWRRSLKARVTIFIVAIFLISIWSLAVYASRILRADMQQALSEQQLSMVSIMAGRVGQELTDRLHALERAAAGIAHAMPDDAASAQRYLNDRTVLQSLFSGGIFATRPDGTAIADVPYATGRTGANFGNRDWVVKALAGKHAIGRPIVGSKLQNPLFGIAVPIRGTAGKVIGALVGVIDLRNPSFLDDIADSRYGKSGGYLLVSVERKTIITGTDKSLIMKPIPGIDANPLLTRFVQGYEGSGVIIDPGGVEVLSSAKRIPVADWVIIARMPTREAFAPIYDMQHRVMVAAIFLTLLAGGLSWLMLRYELAPVFDTIKALAVRSDTDEIPQPLPIARHDEIGELINGFNRLLQTIGKREEELKASEALFRDLFERHAAAKLIIDPKTGEIIDANNQAAEFYGWTREELRQMRIQDINTLPPAEVGQEMEAARAHERVRFEFRHRLADGSIRDVEVFSSRIETKGRELLHSIVHDVTERKRLEAEREDLIAKLQRSFSEIKKLGGLLPICASCKKIRNDQGYWEQLEDYIHEHSDAEFSHGICPDCAKKLYPGLKMKER